MARGRLVSPSGGGRAAPRISEVDLMRMFGGSQRMRTRDRRFTESKMDLKRRLFGYVQDAEGKAKLAKQRQDTALERAQMAEAALAKESTKSGWDRVKDITRKVFQKPRS